MTREATDRLADDVLNAIRNEMIGQTEINVTRLQSAYKRLAEALAEEFRGTVSRATIERIARERLEDLLRETIGPVVEANVLAGAAAGVDTVPSTFAAIFPAATAPLIATELEAQRAAAEVMRGRLIVDRIPLSRRIRRNHRNVARAMAREVQASIRAAENMTDRAKRILAVDTRDQRIPGYIADIEDAARQGGDELRSAVRFYRRQINAQGSAGRGATSIRAGTEELLKRLKAARFADIDGIVDRWVADRAAAHAGMIARTETVRAYRQAYVRSTAEQPFVKGYRWNISSSPRHKPDICDLLANQDLHGLGPGGYPVDGLPPMPHPNDLCFHTAIIDEHHFDRELARENGTEEPPRTWESGTRQTATEWLQGQPESLQREVLGPTRQRMLNDPREPDPIAPDGGIRLVRDLLPADRRRAG